MNCGKFIECLDKGEHGKYPNATTITIWHSKTGEVLIYQVPLARVTDFQSLLYYFDVVEFIIKECFEITIEVTPNKIDY